MQYHVKMSQYFTDKHHILYFKCRKNWKRTGIQDDFFRVAVSLQITVM